MTGALKFMELEMLFIKESMFSDNRLPVAFKT